MAEMETDLTDEEEESTPSLLEFMPPGVLLEIFKFLEWNDLCQVSRTCTKFRDICQSATLWLQLRRLDFRNCSIPDGEKILQVLHRTPNADTLILADVITDETAQQAGMEEEQENIVGVDKFLLNVLRACHRVKNLTLYMHEITDRAVEAISAKCTSLSNLHLHDNLHIENQSILDMLSTSATLNNLHIENCRGVQFLSLKHTDPTKNLNLTSVSLIGMELVLQNVQDLILGCPYLTHLDLSLSQHLQSFNGGLSSRGVKTAMDTLEVLTLQNCDGLEGISLPYCPQLSSLHAGYCRRLEEITATSPLLQNLHTGGCESLRKVELAASDLREFCCDKTQDLETLQLGSDNLSRLNVAYCGRLEADQLVSCVKNKDKLIELNIEGCKGIPPVDLDEKILPAFTSLQRLFYGGHSWNSVRLKSSTLKKLTFTSCNNTTGLPLNMPELQELKLSQCRDFVEQDVMDGLLHGKLIPQKIQSVQILKNESMITPPFSNNTGTPALEVLRLHDLPGLHGDVLSHWLKCLSHMTVLELVRCNFITHLTVEHLPSLVHLKLESCTRLNRLHVSSTQTLETLDVRWCSMVQTMVVCSQNLKNLDLTGTNFAHLSLDCDKLTTLHLSGVATQPEHSLCLRCCSLRELSIVKCDRLSDSTVVDILCHCPVIESFTLVGSLSLGSLHLPSSMQSCSLTGHRILREISIRNPVRKIKHLTLNNLPKFTPHDRLKLLDACEDTLKVLEVRAIRGETDLTLSLRHLTSLTLDQGIQLSHLSINCPRLQYLRIQGCPKLRGLIIHLDKLSQLQVYHSTPLLALRSLTLDCRKVAHLPIVLSYYCPKLEELTLRHCTVQYIQLHLLGEALPYLHTVNMAGCCVLNLPSEEKMFVIERAKTDNTERTHLIVNLDR